MKKFICVIAILCTLFSIAYAEIDLSNMTYNELVSLKDKINLAIWKSSEWQEVTVPRGVYQVGVDIPAGYWTVRVAKGQRWAYVSWGDQLNEEKEGISFWGKRASVNNLIGNPKHEYFESDGGQAEYSFEVYEGEYIVITYADVVFSPFAGKPDLGFKKAAKPTEIPSESVSTIDTQTDMVCLAMRQFIENKGFYSFVKVDKDGSTYKVQLASDGVAALVRLYKEKGYNERHDEWEAFRDKVKIHCIQTELFLMDNNLMNKKITFTLVSDTNPDDVLLIFNNHDLEYDVMKK